MRMWLKSKAHSLVGMFSVLDPLENLIVISQRCKNRASICNSDFTCWYFPLKNNSFTQVYAHLYSLQQLARSWKYTICPMKDECLKKLWYVCTVEHFSHTKELNLLQIR